jgi:hypothetical protein
VSNISYHKTHNRSVSRSTQSLSINFLTVVDQKLKFIRLVSKRSSLASSEVAEHRSSVSKLYRFDKNGNAIEAIGPSDSRKSTSYMGLRQLGQAPDPEDLRRHQVEKTN